MFSNHPALKRISLQQTPKVLTQLPQNKIPTPNKERTE